MILHCVLRDGKLHSIYSSQKESQEVAENLNAYFEGDFEFWSEDIDSSEIDLFY